MNELMEKKALKQKKFRSEISGFAGAISKMPGAKIGHEADEELAPLEHAFVKGVYRRKIFMPKGMVTVSKIHKIDHFYFIMKGKCKVRTEEGLVILEAPYLGVTLAGTQRGIEILEDCVWVTVHLTDSTDLKEIEEQIIAKDFNDPALAHKNLQIEEENNVQNIKE